MTNTKNGKKWTPLFSIATPCFNSEKTIERTIKSVLQQDFKDYEYIIVDGGSKDGTLDIIRKYEPLFEGRMRWISEPDKGIYDAFNKGVNMSNGTYCWNVNSDDYMQPDALSYLAHVISTEDENNSIVISAAQNYVDEATGTILYIEKKDDKMARRCYKLDKMGITHPATIVPRSVYEKYGAFDVRYRLSGDLEWFHRIYSRNVPIIFKDHVITNMSNAGVSSQYTWKRFKVSFNDRKLYFRTYYSNFFVREMKRLLWICEYVRVAVKLKLK